ncbi:MAG: Fe(3+) ABC transporter substrate-binding protein [Pseudomonadota bacterium]|nr:Fe(3+) ABC transporter substrate-binding protein [Pseudomonadota bacterium]
MNLTLKATVLTTAVVALLAGCSKPATEQTDASNAATPKTDTTLVVYSSRNEQLIQPLLSQFTEQTGIKVNLITDKEGPLMARLKAEGQNSPADLLLTVDAGNLWQASQEGLLQAVESTTLNQNIPAHLRDPANQWFGLSIRARTLVHNPDLVNASELSTYEDLADPKWKGKLCLRTSKKVYNQSLVAMLIDHHGEEKTEQIVKGWVANLATDVFPDDTKLIEAVAAGQCGVGIVNSYYYGRLEEKTPDLKAKLFWANQDSTGVHVNISGAGVTRYAPHQSEAVQLIEWLASDQAQNVYSNQDKEYPVLASVSVAPQLQAWGEFKQDSVNVAKYGELQAAAVKLMDRAGYK